MPVNQYAKITPFVNSGGMLLKVNSKNYVMTDKDGNPIVTNNRLKNGEIGIVYDTGDMITLKEIESYDDSTSDYVIMYLNSNIDISEIDIYNNFDEYLNGMIHADSVRSNGLYVNYIDDLTFISNGNFYDEDGNIIKYVVNIKFKDDSNNILESLNIYDEDLRILTESNLYKHYHIGLKNVKTFDVTIKGIDSSGNEYNLTSKPSSFLNNNSEIVKNPEINIKIKYKPNKLKNTLITKNTILHTFDDIRNINGSEIVGNVKITNEQGLINFDPYTDYICGGIKLLSYITNIDKYNGKLSLLLDYSDTSSVSKRLKLKLPTDDLEGMNVILTLYAKPSITTFLCLSVCGGPDSNYSIPGNIGSFANYESFYIQKDSWNKVTYKIPAQLFMQWRQSYNCIFDYLSIESSSTYHKTGHVYNNTAKIYIDNIVLQAYNN